MHVAGRGDGPWVVAAFARGVLLGQATVRPAADGSIDRDVELELPDQAAGVLRVTVFDRALRPVAERLVQRLSVQQVRIALEPAQRRLAPGDPQKVTVRTTDESGEPIAAFVGLSVTDSAALAMGEEPQIGLSDHALLFCDVERLEDLGDWFVGNQGSERKVDLLLGTRGWRRFIWRNDDAARTAIASGGKWAEDQLAREGFAQRPQVVGSRQEAEQAVAPLAVAVAGSWSTLLSSAEIAFWALLIWLCGEGLIAVRGGRRQPWLVGACAVAGGLLLALLVTPSLTSPAARLSADDQVFVADAAAPPVNLAPPRLTRALPFDFAARFWGEPELEGNAADEFFAGRGGRRFGLRGLADEVPDAGAGGRLLRLAEIVDEQKYKRMQGYFDRGLLFQQAVVRQYAHQRRGGAERSDFTDTICWHPLLMTGVDGRAEVEFQLSDAVTTWQVRADAHGQGRVGRGQGQFLAQLPFHIEAKLPVEVSSGDRLQLPVAITVEGKQLDEARVDVALEGPVALLGDRRTDVTLTDGRGRHLVPVVVGATSGAARIRLVGTAGRFRDEVVREFRVAPRGFPHGRSWAGSVAAGAPSKFVVSLPAAAVRGSGGLTLRVFPSPLAMLGKGLQGILQEPRGCFEQASSSNYPNVMVLSFLQASGDNVPAIAARARQLLPGGYAKITGYECKQRGYEWFGGDPGHEALTAYGLLQFHDMQRVYDVDAPMLSRTKDWLLARRSGEGGYLRNERALDSFGSAPQQVTDAYVTYALLHTGVDVVELSREVAVLAERAARTDDAYELALSACALHDAGHEAAAVARGRLSAMQRDDGSLRSSTTSITSSGGSDLAVETTAWAMLALMPDAERLGNVHLAAEFVQSKQTARGTFGATQATICALRALSAYALKSGARQQAGRIVVFAGDKQLAQRRFEAGQAEAVEIGLFGELPPGEHELRIELEDGGDSPLPWACDLGYHAELPADDPKAKVTIATRLLADQVEEGRTVSLELMIENRVGEGLPMTLAVVGLPAGLELPTNVLEDRQKAGDFDLWELRGRELVLYWRSLPPNAERRVRLDLVAAIPGTSSGPASRAYLYYTPEQKRWAGPLEIEVTAAR